MKSPSATPCAIALWLLIIGCSTSKPPTANAPAILAPLTAETAASIAAQAANEKAHSLYDCRPFGVSQTAQFVDGYWLWRERRPRGAVDIEATVVLAADGSPRTVDVTILDNRAIDTRLYRP